jgi:hypothetical protein
MISLLFYLLLAMFNMSSFALPYSDCPRGTFREDPYSRECKPCAKGYYGNARGLTKSTCTSPCPLGTYSDIVGATSVDACKLVKNI